MDGWPCEIVSLPLHTASGQNGLGHLRCREVIPRFHHVSGTQSISRSRDIINP
jgi:hypothetical protein